MVAWGEACAPSRGLRERRLYFCRAYRADVMGHGNAGQLLMHLDYELKSNDARIVCRLEFLAKISMTQMMELSSQAGVSLVCEQLRKLLTYFRFTSDGDVARDDSRQYRMGMEGDIYIGGSDTMF